MEVSAGSHAGSSDPVPEDWFVSTVGSEFEIQLGKMLDAAKNRGTPKPYIGNRAVQWNRIDVADLPQVPLSASEMARFRLRKGDLLVCEGGEVGRSAIWDEQLDECYYQKALHRLRPLRGFDSRLMLAFLHLWSTNGQLQNYVTQTSIAHLTREKLAVVPLPVPSPEEQRAIAEVLDHVNGLLFALTQLIAKKRDLKHAVRQQLLSGDTRLAGFSGRWKVSRIADVAEVDPETLDCQTPADYAFRYISLEDVKRGCLHGHLDLTFALAPSRARRRIRRGDILMATVRPNLQSHLLFDESEENWVCSTGFAVIRCQPELAHPGYIYGHMFGSAVSRQIHTLLAGSNYPAITSGDVSRLEVPLPPLEEQAAIGQVLADMDAEILVLEQRLAKTRALKQGMMQALLTGRVRLGQPAVV